MHGHMDGKLKFKALLDGSHPDVFSLGNINYKSFRQKLHWTNR